MNDAAEDTLTTLLDVVGRDRDGRCLHIREQAEAEAQRIVGEARREARARVGEAIREARHRGQARIADARAALTTEARRRRQEASRAILERAWELLPAALEARWGEEETRRGWMDAMLTVAGRSLPLGTWHVDHPVELPKRDADYIAERITGITGDPPELKSCPDVTAGVRICVGASCLDGRISGLLADRRGVEGRLIAEVLHEVEPSALPFRGEAP